MVGRADHPSEVESVRCAEDRAALRALVDDPARDLGLGGHELVELLPAVGTVAHGSRRPWAPIKTRDGRPGVPLVVLFRYFRSGVVRWAKEILADRDLDLASLVGRSS